MYDSDGELLGFIYNLTPYYYVKNAQGDVCKVVNASGTVVASYTYDAWGKILSATGSMAAINPIRYRGYYYDEETGLYYLNSRYYDPETGRFINADAVGYLGADGTLLSNNLFVYCSNNPVNKVDKTGKLALAIGLFIGVSAVIGGLAGAMVAAGTGGNVLEGALEGAVLGALAATTTILVPISLPTASVAVRTVVSLVVAGAGGIIVDCATQMISYELNKSSYEEFDLDEGRLFKTGLTTGIASVVPTYGIPRESIINAIGSLVISFDASFFNAAAEIVITHFLQ